MAWVCLQITLETLGLAALLRWLPGGVERRLAVAVVAAGAIEFLLLANNWTDQPGYAYSNLIWTSAVLLTLLVTTVVFAARALALRVLSSRQAA